MAIPILLSVDRYCLRIEGETPIPEPLSSQNVPPSGALWGMRCIGEAFKAAGPLQHAAGRSRQAAQAFNGHRR
jgi:hypothetical protein